MVFLVFGGGGFKRRRKRQQMKDRFHGLGRISLHLTCKWTVFQVWGIFREFIAVYTTEAYRGVLFCSSFHFENCIASSASEEILFNNKFNQVEDIHVLGHFNGAASSKIEDEQLGLENFIIVVMEKLIGLS